jgi:Predicted Na+-dependent transporter
MFMSRIWTLFRSIFDNYTLTLIGVVALATIFPVYGAGVAVASAATKLVVALLFFLHGLKLSPQSLWAGLTHWRLHLSILAATFVMFPVLGLLMKPLFVVLVGPSLYAGLLFVCVLPSTVQTSIAFTSIAKGNVAAAVCAASASSLLGVFFTPLLVGFLMNTVSGGFSGQAIIDLCVQLLLPFAAGQALRGQLAGFINRHKSLVGYADRLSVLFIIYASFSNGATSGLWDTVNVNILVLLCLACSILLAAALF